MFPTREFNVSVHYGCALLLDNVTLLCTLSLYIVYVHCPFSVSLYAVPVHGALYSRRVHCYCTRSLYTVVVHCHGTLSLYTITVHYTLYSSIVQCYCTLSLTLSLYTKKRQGRARAGQEDGTSKRRVGNGKGGGGVA